MDTTPSVWSTTLHQWVVGPIFRFFLEPSSHLVVFDGETALCRSDTNLFFSWQHQVLVPAMRGYCLVPRRRLIKHLMIQSSDIDHDDLASEGIGRILSLLCPADITESEYRNKSRKTSEQWAGLGILRFFETQCLKPSTK